MSRGACGRTPASRGALWGASLPICTTPPLAHQGIASSASGASLLPVGVAVAITYLAEHPARSCQPAGPLERGVRAEPAYWSVPSSLLVGHARRTPAAPVCGQLGGTLHPDLSGGRMHEPANSAAQTSETLPPFVKSSNKWPSATA